MKLDDILAEWAQDCIIDETVLSSEALRAPKLHHKYVMILARERLTLSKYERDYKILFRDKTEYYLGNLDMETMNRYGWAPRLKMVLKTDSSMYIESDTDIQALQTTISIQKEKIAVLDYIMKAILKWDFTVKNSIDYQRFMAGNG